MNDISSANSAPREDSSLRGDPTMELFGLGWRPSADQSVYIGRHRLADSELEASVASQR